MTGAKEVIEVWGMLDMLAIGVGSGRETGMRSAQEGDQGRQRQAEGLRVGCMAATCREIGHGHPGHLLDSPVPPLVAIDGTWGEHATSGIVGIPAEASRTIDGDLGMMDRKKQVAGGSTRAPSLLLAVTSGVLKKIRVAVLLMALRAAMLATRAERGAITARATAPAIAVITEVAAVAPALVGKVGRNGDKKVAGRAGMGREWDPKDAGGTVLGTVPRLGIVLMIVSMVCTRLEGALSKSGQAMVAGTGISRPEMEGAEKGVGVRS